MTYLELLAAVYVKTNRPDLVDQTAQAVVSSTLALHTMDFFYKDIKTYQIVFDHSLYLQSMDTGIFPRYRSLSYFRKNDPSFSTFQQNPIAPIPSDFYNRTAPIKIITPDDIFDDYLLEKIDVGYQAGATIYIKSGTPLQFGLLGLYQFPNLDTSNDGANFDSWIAREFPFGIVFDAASNILQTIGMTDAARKYDSPNGGLVQTWKDIIVKNNILPVGS